MSIIRSSPSGPAFDAPDLVEAAMQIGWQPALGPSDSLLVLPAGHPPGQYLVGFSTVVRVVGGGSLTLTSSFTLPTIGASSFTIPGIVFSALGITSANSFNRCVVSNGLGPVRTQYVGVGVTGNPLIDVYSSAILIGAI